MKAKCKVIFFLLTFIPTCAIYSQKNDNITVNVDFESALSILNLIGRPTADTNEISQVARLYGNRQLKAKVKSYSGAGEDRFKSSLKEIIETGEIKGNDLYNWREVKSQLPAVKQLIGYLAAEKAQFLHGVKQLVMPYVPDTLTAEARACFLLGGGALGFVIGGDPTFNVALQRIGNDREGLKYLVAHELYHSLQDCGQSTRKKNLSEKAPDPILTCYYLLYNLWLEGSANYVADLSTITQPGEFSKAQQAALKKNHDRKRENFALFEALLFRQFYDSSASYESSYNIAFTTGYDEMGYAVGAEMAKMIVKYDGAQGLSKILVSDPLLFARQYVKLYKLHRNDKSFIRFSEMTEEIIEKLAPWIDKI